MRFEVEVYTYGSCWRDGIGFHRMDGPAINHVNDRHKSWRLYNKKYSKEEFERIVRLRAFR